MNDAFKSATLKLTLWYLAIVMAICVVFSGVVYHFAGSELASSLSAQTQRIYERFPVFNDNPFFVHGNDVAVASHHILLNLLYFNIVVLIIAGFLSYWLARRTLRPIEAANDEQKRFVADASHELRTPLTALKMSTEVALMDPAASKAELHAVLQSNLEEAVKLDSLLSNLLRLSRLESDEFQHGFTRLMTTELLDAAAERVAPQAEAKHIAITRTGKGEPMQGDRESLVQLVVILLDNAIKYSPEGSSVTIRTGNNSEYTTVSIADQGSGIAPEDLNHVFDRFYRADKARTGNSGYGLGLAIAKRIADMHRGSITVKSTVGKGTTVLVNVPRESD